MINFNVLDAFVQVELEMEEGEKNLQGILFRDNSDFGIIIPRITGIEEGLKLITIKSPLYPREFEFTPTKDFMAIENEYLMFLPIEEIECNGELKHKTRVYSKEELRSIRYVMSNHFGYLSNVEYYYFLTYMNGLTKGIVTNTMFRDLGYTQEEDGQNGYNFVSVLDASLYDGSPLIATNQNNIFPNPKELIQGIFIKNPEYIPELENMPNTGIVVGADFVFDLIKKL